MTPNPPKRVGRAKSFLSLSVRLLMSVMAGRNLDLGHSYSGFSVSAGTDIGLFRWLHLLRVPWMKAEYAACGSVLAISVSSNNSSIHS